MVKEKVSFPETVDAAVRLLQSMVPDDELSRIAALAENELEGLDFGLGQWIRNQLGLWSENPRLMRDTGESHPDDASRVIIVALWQTLQRERPKVH